MKRRALVLLLISLTLSGCGSGISSSEYEAAVSARTTAEDSLSAAQEEIASLKDELDQARAEIETLRASLQEEVAKVESSAEKPASNKYASSDTKSSVSEGDTLIDANDILVVYKGMQVDDYAIHLDLYMENNSDRNVGLATKDESLNGFVTTITFGEDIPPQKKANKDIYISRKRLEDNNITLDELTDIEFTLFAYDRDTRENLYTTDPLSFTPDFTSEAAEVADNKSTVKEEKTEPKQEETKKEEVAAEQPKQEETTTEKPKEEAPSSVPAEGGQALKKAYTYLAVLPYSHDGLIDQLVYDGFPDDTAKYAADNCGADWNEQAVKKAKQYLDVLSYSKSGLIDQLVYDKFTRDQATYGAEQALQ